MKTKLKRFKTIKAVWKALDEGKEVFWVNSLYHVTVEPAKPHNNLETLRNGQLLRVTCKDNYFGSLLTASELGKLYAF